MELGGLFGSLLAGRISDAWIARNPKGGNVGKRVQVSSHHQQSEAAGMGDSMSALHPESCNSVQCSHSSVAKSCAAELV